MATVAETITAYSALGTRIYQATDSGLYSAEESALLSQLHTAVTAVVRNFHNRPAHGPQSPEYEPAIASANNAATELAKAETGRLAAAVTAIRAAIQTLVGVTARRQAEFGLRGSLRLAHESAANTAEAAPGDAPAGSGGDPNYYNKLITLFPAEALTLYGTGVAIFGGAGAGRSAFYVIILCLVVLLLVRWKANQPKTTTGGTDRSAVSVAVISFMLWATATDPSWIGEAPKFFSVIPGTYDADLIRKWAAFLGAAFVFVAPNFVEAKETP